MPRRVIVARAARWTVATVLLGAAGCADAATEPEEQFVVQAYLYAGESVTDVRVTRTRALSSEDTTVAPINDAEIRLTKGGVSVVLTPTGEDGYYHYAGTDLAVEVGDVFELEVTYAGRTATAETTVPPSPVGVAVSKTTVLAPELGFGGGGPGGGPGGVDTATQVAVTWSNPNQELHFVTVKSIEENPVSFLPDELENLFGSVGFRMVTQPDSDDVQLVNSGSLRYYGQYQVSVYRINPEYAQLYENRTQDSRDLNEPPTNIRDGLGVFSAFSSAKVSFAVVER